MQTHDDNTIGTHSSCVQKNKFTRRVQINNEDMYTSLV